MELETKARLARQFIEAIPHANALGMQIDDIGHGVIRASMPYDERFIGDPETGVIHGGAVFALMDSCSGAAVVTHPDAPMVTATLDLRIDYMRAATPGQRVNCEATCYHITRSVAFVRAVAYDDDRDNPVATASGAFTADSGKGAKRSSEALS